MNTCQASIGQSVGEESGCHASRLDFVRVSAEVMPHKPLLEAGAKRRGLSTDNFVLGPNTMPYTEHPYIEHLRQVSKRMFKLKKQTLQLAAEVLDLMASLGEEMSSHNVLRKVGCAQSIYAA
ncbi:hypothetical protein WJX72_005194 [[Myrmecia] bisecta]|uniref:Uncharacterized protein n=1 Tax=[Myrmecia] bisecta TaxID=41462 RepID=A0AAW1R6N3_9CHLO